MTESDDDAQFPTNSLNEYLQGFDMSTDHYSLMEFNKMCNDAFQLGYQNGLTENVDIFHSAVGSRDSDAVLPSVVQASGEDLIDRIVTYLQSTLAQQICAVLKHSETGTDNTKTVKVEEVEEKLSAIDQLLSMINFPFSISDDHGQFRSESDALKLPSYDEDTSQLKMVGNIHLEAVNVQCQVNSELSSCNVRPVRLSDKSIPSSQLSPHLKEKHETWNHTFNDRTRLYSSTSTSMTEITESVCNILQEYDCSQQGSSKSCLEQPGQDLMSASLIVVDARIGNVVEILQDLTESTKKEYFLNSQHKTVHNNRQRKVSQRFACDQCSASYKNSFSLNRHVKDKHAGHVVDKLFASPNKQIVPVVQNCTVSKIDRHATDLSMTCSDVIHETKDDVRSSFTMTLRRRSSQPTAPSSQSNNLLSDDDCNSEDRESIDSDDSWQPSSDETTTKSVDENSKNLSVLVCANRGDSNTCNVVIDNNNHVTGLNDTEYCEDVEMKAFYNGIVNDALQGECSLQNTEKNLSPETGENSLIAIDVHDFLLAGTNREYVHKVNSDSHDNQVFTSDKCSITYKCKPELAKHPEGKQSVAALSAAPSFLCEICTNGYSYKSRASLLCHYFKMHPGHISPTVGLMQEAEERSGDMNCGSDASSVTAKRFACYICPANYGSVQNLSNHWKEKHSESYCITSKFFACDTCPARYKYAQCLKKHSEAHCENKNQEHGTRSDVKIWLTGSNKMENTVTNFKSDILEASVINHMICDSLSRDQVNRADSSKAVCESVNETSSLASVGEKFLCNGCDRTFPKYTSLMHHKRILGCGERAAATSDSGAGQVKQVPNSNGGDFKCDKCRYSTNSQSNLYCHKYTKHKFQELKCPLCDLTLYKQAALKAHLVKQHKMPLNLIACSECLTNVSEKAAVLLDQKLNNTCVLSSSLEEKPQMLCSRCESRSSRMTSIAESFYEHGMRKFRCLKCQVVYKHSENLRKHWERHHTETCPRFNCDQCAEVYRDKTSLKRHWKLRHSEEAVANGTNIAKPRNRRLPKPRGSFQTKSSTDCESTLIQSEQLILSEKKQRKKNSCNAAKLMKEQPKGDERWHPDNVLDTDIKRFKSKMLEQKKKLHSKETTMIEEIKCGTCLRTFTSTQYLKVHRRHCSKKKATHECPLCSKRFVSLSRLSEHRSSMHWRGHLTSNLPVVPHVSKRKYKPKTGRMRITKCEKSVPFSYYVYECKLCGEKCSCKQAFDGHNSFVHGIGSKLVESAMHICEFCGEIYQDYTHFVQHHSNHTGKWMFKCETCGRGFMYRRIYQRHVVTHSDLRPFKCSECEWTFRSVVLLKSHMTHTHPLTVS